MPSALARSVRRMRSSQWTANDADYGALQELANGHLALIAR